MFQVAVCSLIAGKIFCFHIDYLRTKRNQEDVCESSSRPYAAEGTAAKVLFLRHLYKMFEGPRKRRGREFLVYGASPTGGDEDAEKRLDLDQRLLQPLAKVTRSEEDGRGGVVDAAAELLGAIVVGGKDLDEEVVLEVGEAIIYMTGYAYSSLKSSSLSRSRMIVAASSWTNRPPCT